MPRAAAAHGTYRAYLRCRVRPEGACAPCVAAKDARSAKNSTSAAARLRKQAEEVAPPPSAVPLTAEGHVSRLEVLKEQLEQSRALVKTLQVKDPARAYLQMREQREILREIAELQGNGQAKGVTLADQLEEARSRRRAAAAAAAGT